MAFSVAKSRPFRSLRLYRSSGKHAAPRRAAQPASLPVVDSATHRRAHAVSMPRLTGPAASQKTAA
jgi:hypothetical protein